MKSKTVSVRVEEKDRETWGKAAREYKNLSAFFVAMIRDAWRFRHVIEQAKKLEQTGFKISAMEVK